MTSLTLKVAGSFESISSASCSFFMTSCSSFASILLSNKPWIVQYSLEIKVEISFSLSVINFNTTDWTLPADKEPIFLFNKVESLNPIIRSIILLVSCDSTKDISITRGFSNAPNTAGLVISWNSILLVVFGSKCKSSARCQEIASPSLSGSVASKTSSASLAFFISSRIIFALSFELTYVGLKSFSTSIPSPPLPEVDKSLIWPHDATTLKLGPRYFLIVWHFVGDSTITSFIIFPPQD